MHEDYVLNTQSKPVTRADLSPVLPCKPLRPLSPSGQQDQRLSEITRGIGFTHISLRIDRHFWHDVVVFHVFLGDVTAVLDRFNALAKLVGFDASGINGGLGDECHAGRGHECLRRFSSLTA